MAGTGSGPTLGPVTTEHDESYTCSGGDWSRFVWSDVSDPLPIMVTGRRGAAQPGTRVPSGNPTLGPCAVQPKTSSGLPTRTEPRKENQVREFKLRVLNRGLCSPGSGRRSLPRH